MHAGCAPEKDERSVKWTKTCFFERSPVSSWLLVVFGASSRVQETETPEDPTKASHQVSSPRFVKNYAG